MVGSGILPPPYESDRRVGSPGPSEPSESRNPTIRVNMVGTTMALVTDSARTRATQSAASKVGSCTTRRPA